MKKISKKWIWVFAMILFLSNSVTVTWGTPTPQLYEYYNTGDSTCLYAYDTYWNAQTFTVGATGHTGSSVKLKLFRQGSPGTVTVSIRATSGLGQHPTGSDLTIGTIDGNSLTTDTSGAWYEIPLTEYSLSPNTKYVIVVRALSGDLNNRLWWRVDYVAPAYEKGNNEYSDDGGNTWATRFEFDCMFEVWSGGLPPPPPPPGPTVGLINPLFCKDIPCVIDAIINFIFYFGITIFTLMIIIGGIMYITSAGDPQKISTAKRLLFWAVVGLAIILLAKGLISVIKNILGGG
jgi:hypothetical protein